MSQTIPLAKMEEVQATPARLASPDAVRKLLLRFVGAVDDQWSGEEFDEGLFRKLADEAREALWASSPENQSAAAAKS